MGVESAYSNFSQGNIGAGIVDSIGVVVDAAAAAVPYVPGGAGTAIKAARGVDKAVEGARDAKATGVIYRVTGEATPSGKPYIGRSDDIASRRSDDGRDRSQAEVIGTYPKGDTQAGRVAEQQAINANGGISNLDNKRNEIAPAKWKEKGVE